MSKEQRQPATFRFAPSPNGRLHLGHALSALTNQRMAREAGGRLLIRIEDIDATRCTPELEVDLLNDLAWLGIVPDGPIRRQSDHLGDYADALAKLAAMGVLYPAFLTRGDVRQKVSDAVASGIDWPRDPDGAPLYPDHDRRRPAADRAERLAAGERHAIRLDMARALQIIGRPVRWHEMEGTRTRQVTAAPEAWGDVVLSRSDAPGSYALCVVIDDALQGVTHVVRGMDLREATAVQRVLQILLGLPEPVYHHHRLILGDDGRKLSKSTRSTSLAELRASGLTPSDIRRLVGL